MQYPLDQPQGWPFGSGRVESGNKVVVQARLKGAGRRGQRSHVNPMLSLRPALYNDRGEEAWGLACKQHQQQRQQRRFLRQKTRREAAAHKRQVLLLRLVLLACRPRPKPSKASSRSCSATPTGPHRPAPDHPWRRRLLAKK